MAESEEDGEEEADSVSPPDWSHFTPQPWLNTSTIPAIAMPPYFATVLFMTLLLFMSMKTTHAISYGGGLLTSTIAPALKTARGSLSSRTSTRKHLDFNGLQTECLARVDADGVEGPG